MISKKKLSKKFYFITFAITIFIYSLSINFELSNFIDRKIYDILSKIELEKRVKSANSVIVKIDQKSLEALGQWPWSRLIVAKMIQNIEKSYPASIGIDIIFSEADRTSPKILNAFYKQNLNLDTNFSSIPKSLWDNDLILSNTLSKSTITSSIIASNSLTKTNCNPKNFIDYNGDFSNFFQTNFFTCNTKKIQNNIKNSGFINAHTSKDGILRDYVLAYKYKDQLVPSLGVSMLKSVDQNMLFTDQKSFLAPYKLEFLDHIIKTDEQGEVLNYIHLPSRFKTISAIDVLIENFSPSLFSGKFVLIGNTAVGLSDFYSVHNGERVTGLYSHASFIQNALHDTLLYSPMSAKYLAYILSFLFASFIIILTISQNYILSIALCFIASLVVGVITYILLYFGFYFPLGFFVTPLFLSYFFILTLISYLSQKKEKELSLKILQIRSSLINNMMTMIETRDTETGNHILRTKEYAKVMASYLSNTYKIHSQYLNPTTINHIYQATPLHDIGKIGIPDSILKKEGKLTDKEMNIMKTHPKIGYDILENSKEIDSESSFYQVALNIVYAHHEKWDGSGYPRGLKGDNIPLEARIVALCDVYDALTSKRCYKDAYDFKKAKRILLQESGYHFDPILITSFLNVEYEFKKIAIRYKD